AEGPAADPVAPELPGLVTRPDLSHLDPAPVLLRKILDELAEIDPLFGGERECHPPPVEGAVDVDDLEVDIQVPDLRAPVLGRITRHGPPALVSLDIFGGGEAEHPLQRW